ncbi:MAG: abortive infection family protein [Nitrospirales bacterium]
MDKKLRDKLVLNIKRCIEVQFSESDWDELAYLTNGKSIIFEHPRLLRSFSFGDDDYGSCIFTVVEQLLDRDSANLQTIIEYINLPVWLKENNQKDFEALYGHTQPLLNTVEQTAIANSFELNQHIARISRAIETDPELAVGSTKEMLESVLKTILEGFGEESGKDDLPKLLKRTQHILKLDPSDIDPSAKGAEITKRILSNLGQVVTGINELRNLYGTGHGKARKSSITPRHARLVVGAGATLTTFLMEIFEMRQTLR